MILLWVQVTPCASMCVYPPLRSPAFLGQGPSCRAFTDVARPSFLVASVEMATFRVDCHRLLWDTCFFLKKFLRLPVASVVACGYATGVSSHPWV